MCFPPQRVRLVHKVKYEELRESGKRGPSFSGHYYEESTILSSTAYSAPAPKMPPGIVELMEGLAKDVLKNNPGNIYEFCAQHLQKLLEIRDGKVKLKEVTLEEKISKAISKIRYRAEQRKSKYNNEIEMQRLHYLKMNIMEENLKEEIVEEESLANNEENLNHGKEEIKTIKVEGTDEQMLKENKTLKKNLDPKKETSIQLCKNEPPLTSSVSTLWSDSQDNISDKGLPENFDSSEENQSILRSSNELETSLQNYDVPVPIADLQNATGNPLLMATEEQYTLEAHNENAQDSDINYVTNNDFVNNEQDSIKTELSAKSDEGDNTIKIVAGNSIDEQSEDKDSDVKSNNINNMDYSKISINKDAPENVIVVGFDNTGTKTLILTEVTDTVSSTERYLNKNNLEGNVERNNSIDLSMDLEKAAITIQKVFRAFLFKSKTLSVDDVTNVDVNLFIKKTEDEIENSLADNLNNSKVLNRMDTVLQTVNEEKSLSLSTEDSSTLSSAATIIQAHVRGFLTRNKMHLNTTSMTSAIDSDIRSINSLDDDNYNRKSKTVLNIHIVPEEEHVIYRDESILTSVDLSLDASPPYPTNLHPLGYDKNERRKQLKREDAVQSVSPPSNNSGKLSEDIDSVKEILCKDSNSDTVLIQNDGILSLENSDKIFESKKNETINFQFNSNSKQLSVPTSDEMDVITPSITDGTITVTADSKSSHFLHSGEFHDIALPTIVSRNNTSVARGE